MDWRQLERDRGREEGGRVDGWRPGAGCWGVDLGLSWGEDLAQGFRFTQELRREIKREILKWRSGRRVKRPMDCWL